MKYIRNNYLAYFTDSTSGTSDNTLTPPLLFHPHATPVSCAAQMPPKGGTTWNMQRTSSMGLSFSVSNDLTASGVLLVLALALPLPVDRRSP